MLLVAPLVLYMVVLYALPVVTMLMRSFNDPTWSLVHYRELMDDSVFFNTLINTLYTAFIVTLGTLVLDIRSPWRWCAPRNGRR